MWVLLGAVIVGELVPIKLGTAEGEVTPSTTFAFALLLSSGPAPAAIAVALGAILAERRDPTASAPARIAFNAAQYVITVAAAGVVLARAGVLPHRPDASSPATCRASSPPRSSSSSSTRASSPAPSRSRRSASCATVSSDLFLQAATAGLLLGLSPAGSCSRRLLAVLLPLLALPLLAVQRAGRQALVNERLALHDALTGLPNRVAVPRPHRAGACAPRGAATRASR